MSRPSIARVYDFMLGGRDNYEVDRQVAREAMRIAPEVQPAALGGRAFLCRVVRFLAAEAGIRQFLDIGSGLPTRGNVHEIAQRVHPDARVVYVDNDPIVIAYAQALLVDNRTTAAAQGDLRRPAELLADPVIREFIDFGQPIALLLFGILHHIQDDEDPAGIMATLRAALAPGSYLAIGHFHNPGAERPASAEQAERLEKLFYERLGTGRWRSLAEIMDFFGDLKPVEPGLVPMGDWRPDADEPETDLGHIRYNYVGGVARKG